MKRRMWALLFVVMMVAMLNPVLCAWAEDEPVLFVESSNAASSQEPVQQENQTQQVQKTRSRLEGRTADPKAVARSARVAERTPQTVTQNQTTLPVQEHVNAPKPEAENRTVEFREDDAMIILALETETSSIPRPIAETIVIRSPGDEEEFTEENDGEEAEPEEAEETLEEGEIILVDVDEEMEEETESATTDEYALTENDFAINVQQPTLAVRGANDMYTVDGNLVVTLAIRSNATYAANLLLTPEMSDDTLSAYARLGLYPADASRTMSIGAGEEVDVQFTFNRAEEVNLSLVELEGMMQADALYFPVGIEIVAA